MPAYKYTPEAIKKVIKSKPLNALGLQSARYLYAKAARLSCDVVSRRNKKINQSWVNAKASIAENGYACINDYLNPEAFQSLLDDFNAIMEKKYGDDLSIKDGGTIVDRRGMTGREVNESGLYGIEEVVGDSELKSLLEALVNREIDLSSTTFWFDIIYNGETGCSQNALHTDVFFDTYKVWYFVEDVSIDDGPLVYCPKSSNFTLWRMVFEYVESLPKDGIISQPHKASNYATRHMAAPEKIAVPANTLVIANTHGFHSRGEAKPGTNRKQIHFSLRENPYKWFAQ